MIFSLYLTTFTFGIDIENFYRGCGIYRTENKIQFVWISKNIEDFMEMEWVLIQRTPRISSRRRIGDFYKC